MRQKMQAQAAEKLRLTELAKMATDRAEMEATKAILEESQFIKQEDDELFDKSEFDEEDETEDASTDEVYFDEDDDETSMGVEKNNNNVKIAQKVHVSTDPLD